MISPTARGKRTFTTCSNCGNEYETLVKYMQNSKSGLTFCSRGCSISYRKEHSNQIVVHCAVCNKEVMRRRDVVERNKTGQFFCSSEHQDTAAIYGSGFDYRSPATGVQPSSLRTNHVCKNCGKRFSETRVQKSFCSSTCKDTYRNGIVEKQCKDCKTVKEIERFPKSKGSADGYTQTCNDCVAQRWQGWYGEQRLEKQKANAARNKGYQSTDKGKASEHRKRLKRYGLSSKEYEELLAKYDGNCHSCLTKPAVAIDHDHTTSLVRGLLCSPCNLGIGMLGDSLDGVEAALRYLRLHADTNK